MDKSSALYLHQTLAYERFYGAEDDFVCVFSSHGTFHLDFVKVVKLVKITEDNDFVMPRPREFLS